VNKFSLLCFLFLPILVKAADLDCLSGAVIKNKPIGYFNTEGKGTGVHWDFLKAIGTEADICINNELLPFARVWQGLESGSYDLAVGFSSPARDDKVIKVALIRELKTVVVGTKGLNIRDYEDLIGLKIGKTRSTKLNRHFDQDSRLNIVELNDYKQAVTMLMAGRIDALAGSYKAIRYQTEKAGFPKYLIRSGFHLLGVKQQWLHMSKTSEFKEYIPQLKKAVNKLKKSGTLATLVSKHYLTQ